MTLDTILPSLSSLGVLAYWLIAAASALEAWFVTGVVLPGTLIVDAGGLLVQRGVLEFWDLVWFVAAGSVLGAEASYWTGRYLHSRRPVTGWKAYGRAEALFRRWGGLALVLGRFAGPVAGLVPLVAALAGMERRRFLIWSVAGSIPYAVAHVGFGYLLGGALAQMGPVLTRAALILGAVAFGLALTAWIVWRLVRLLPRMVPVVQALGARVAAHPRAQTLAGRHPALTQFLTARFAQGRFDGLPLTALAAVFAYLATLWLDGLFDFMHFADVRQLDARLAELIHVFWTPGLLRLAAHVTALGDWRVVVSLGLSALIWLGLRGRRDLALGLAFAVAGNQATVTLMKTLFGRPRPELARFVETSGSFPSGHAAVAVAFWGMLAYAFWRSGRLPAVAAALSAAVLALAIGVSRLYLIEHFLSDVVNGWLVGALWLLAGVTLAEWLKAGVRPHLPLGLRRAAELVILLLVFWAGWTTARYDKALALPPAETGVVLASPADLFGSHPRRTESLLGNPLEPINLILVAPDAATLTTALTRAGWTEARMPSPTALLDTAWALVVNHPDPDAPVTPYFWNGAPNDLAFERAAETGGPVKRHHVRLWQTGTTLPDGSGLWVAAASFDDGLDRNLLHHIAPDLDAERDKLAADLLSTGAGELPSPPDGGPMTGTSVAGDPWRTDGRVRVLRLSGM